jgi:transcriptional regulator
MFVPVPYRELDQDRLDAFLSQHDFATVVSSDGGAPIASHLLVEFERRGDGSAWLAGHMSRANPQWRTFGEGREVLAIFLGPHTYIPARWYGHVNVPTWNYLAVHVYGTPELVTDDEEVRVVLKRLVDRHEADADADPPYRLETLPPDFVAREIRGIVAFRVRVSRMEASYKLSQTRNDADHANIIAELEQRGDEHSIAIARAMRLTRP